VEGQQYAEARGHHSVADEPLHDVEIGGSIAFDQDRTVGSDGNVPADEYPVTERPVRADREIADLVPHRQPNALDPCPTHRMGIHPAQTAVSAKIARGAKNAGFEVDGSGNSAGMKIVHDVIPADLFEAVAEVLAYLVRLKQLAI